MRQLLPYRSVDPFREMDRMIDRMRSAWADEARTSGLALNVAEDDDALHIEAAVPGLSEDQIDVRIEGDQLTISGQYENRYEQKDEGRRWHVVEQSYGSFCRSIQLPQEVNVDNVSADLENGILTITLPKTSPSPVKKIAVKAKKMLKGGK